MGKILIELREIGDLEKYKKAYKSNVYPRIDSYWLGKVLYSQTAYWDSESFDRNPFHKLYNQVEKTFQHLFNKLGYYGTYYVIVDGGFVDGCIVPDHANGIVFGNSINAPKYIFLIKELVEDVLEPMIDPARIFVRPNPTPEYYLELPFV